MYFMVSVIFLVVTLPIILAVAQWCFGLLWGTARFGRDVAKAIANDLEQERIEAAKQPPRTLGQNMALVAILIPAVGCSGWTIWRLLGRLLAL